jgi:hypothetical protein
MNNMEAKELYSEYLGKGYHGKVRKKIGADDILLPDSIIDADVNIGAMKRLVAPAIENMQAFGKFVDTDKKYSILQDAAINMLCAILCIALKSRTSAPPYDNPEYKRNWDKKREKFIQFGNSQLMGLMKMG